MAHQVNSQGHRIAQFEKIAELQETRREALENDDLTGPKTSALVKTSATSEEPLLNNTAQTDPPRDPFRRMEEFYNHSGEAWERYRDQADEVRTLTDGPRKEILTITPPADGSTATVAGDSDLRETTAHEPRPTPPAEEGSLSLEGLLTLLRAETESSVAESPHAPAGPGEGIADESTSILQRRLEPMEPTVERTTPDATIPLPEPSSSKGAAYAFSNGESSYHPQGIHAEFTRPGITINDFSDTVTQRIERKGVRRT